MKIYSYLDSGTAVLATDLPTHTQVLDDTMAHLVPPEPAAMGEGMLRLLTDEGLRRRLVTEASRRVHEEHSRPAYLRKLFAFYDHIERRLMRDGYGERVAGRRRRDGATTGSEAP
jgi:glycosyltransferase involved in cell wall biosynthesis